MKKTLCNAALTVRRRQFHCALEAGHLTPYHIDYDRAAWSDDLEMIHIAMNEVLRRYPRLIAAVKWACIATTSEARSGVEGYINGYGGSEAIQSYGGCLAAVRGGIRARHFLRKQYPGYLNHLLPTAELQAA